MLVGAAVQVADTSVTLFHPWSAEVMAVVQVAMLAGLPYTALRDAILTHQTMAEGLAALFSSVPRG